MRNKMKNTGFSIHCHHDILVEYCYDYEGRMQDIKDTKSANEIKTRLRLFKILPDEALKDLPIEYQEADQKRQEANQKREEANQKWQEADQKQEEAYQEWQEAYQEWQEANQKWQEAYQKWQEADQEWQEADQKQGEAYQKWQEANQKWQKADKDAFHKKWCDCKEWNGEKIVF